MIVALALLFAGSAGAQETKTIKGMVRDVTGEPLIGASVIEKGTNNGVITDVDGNFTLTVPADATLSIAYMGYATREIHLAKRKKQGDLRVTLREDSFPWLAGLDAPEPVSPHRGCNPNSGPGFETGTVGHAFHPALGQAQSLLCGRPPA